MAAPMDYFSHMLGNSHDFVQKNFPQIQQMEGQGLPIVWDIARSAPPSTAQNIPHYWSEEEQRK